MSILLVLGLILLIAWIAGIGTRRTYGGLVHIALVVALILLIVWLLREVLGVL
jgi:hypothetical protein